MSKILIVEPEKCTSCRLCELACSERQAGIQRPARAHVRVTINVDEAFYFPRICLQCEDAECVEACPTEALTRDDQTGAITVQAEECTACGLCVDACSYGAIRVWDDLAHKCDLCGGDPECVRFCPSGALRYESPESWSAESRGAYAERLRGLIEEAQA